MRKAEREFIGCASIEKWSVEKESVKKKKFWPESDGSSSEDNGK